MILPSNQMIFIQDTPEKIFTYQRNMSDFWGANWASSPISIDLASFANNLGFVTVDNHLGHFTHYTNIWQRLISHTYSLKKFT